MKRISICLLIVLMLSSCKEDGEELPPSSSSEHLEYFGFTLIDTYWDDPTDSEVITNYAEEIHNFSNIADILVVSPSDNMSQRLRDFTDLDMKAVLHISEVFFELVDENSPSGANYSLRTDYEERWNQFRILNQETLNTNHIGALYIGEEPTWNGISYVELNAVSTLLKSDLPTIPIMIIEAYPALNDLQVPESVDWIGFDHYFIKDPNTDPIFQDEYQILKSKLSSSSQRIIIIMDSHYIDWAHGDVGNIDINEMDVVAESYYQLAKRDEDVIGILGYFWPNGFDTPESIGARGMPPEVKSAYERIGREITGK